MGALAVGGGAMLKGGGELVRLITSIWWTGEQGGGGGARGGRELPGEGKREHCHLLLWLFMLILRSLVRVVGGV